MAPSWLPGEIWDKTFAQLSPSSLVSASLACRNWRAHAFPHLYHTVYLCFSVHLREFALRVAFEQSDLCLDGFPVIPYVKSLVLDAEFLDEEAMEEYVDEDDAVRITEQDMDYLRTLAIQLNNLQSLSWKLLFIPQELDIFYTFSTRCPNLRSVHVSMERDYFTSSADYLELLPFTNLSEFSFSAMDITYDFAEDFAPALSRLLASSPNLTVLKLDCESKDGERRYDPNTLIAALGESREFHYLHTFHGRGAAIPDWYEFFSYPESSNYPLRTFLSRHPGIRDLSLGNVPGGRLYQDIISPEELAKLFASVVHFEGPTFILSRLVVSSVASRLESLALNNFQLCAYEDSGPLAELRGKISLPRLRKFAIRAWEAAETVQWDLLETIINAAPQLEEIEAKASSQCFKEKDVISKLSGASRLRVLAISSDFVSQAHRFEITDGELVAYTVKLARAFPRLEIVKYGEPYTRERACTVLRTESGLRARCERIRTIRPS